MTSLDTFRTVASVGAALGIVAILAPATGGRSAAPRRAAGLATTVAAWALLAGSLVTTHDLHRAADKLHSPLRAGAAVVGVVVAVVVGVLLVRLVVRRPSAFFVLLALALPVRIPITFGAQQANLLVPLYAVILIGIAGWVWGRARGRFGEEGEGGTPIDLPLGAFVAFSLVSLLWSDDIQQGTIKIVFFYIPFVLLYRLVVAWWREAKEALRALTVTTMAMAAPVALLAIGQYATRTIWWNDTLKQGNVYNRFFRANGIFYDPNILGRYLVLAILATVAVAWVTRSGRRLALLGALGALYTGGLIVTFSRSSALELVIGLALLAWRAFGWKRTVLVGGAALVVLGLAAIAGSHQVRHLVTSEKRLSKVSEGRTRLVRGGFDIWKDAPVAGTGIGSFAKRYKETLTQRQQRRTRVFISHNAPITVLTELGAVGFALFIALGVSTVLWIWRSSRAKDAAAWAQWTLLAMLIGIFVHSLLYSALFEDPYTWVIAGAAIAIGLVRAVQEVSEPAPVPTEPLPAT
ncbi:MAG TPA: O-antigen ligase family protein [Miltoncostaeaceae bacterium]|nr:O-antigen ligase family protein [Miltoncostaeaceae bacterium]